MPKNITILLVAVSFLISCKFDKQKENSKNTQKAESSVLSKIYSENLVQKDSLTNDFVQINFKESGFVEKMVYATQDNFTKEKIYPCAECFLRKEVAEALQKAKEKAEKQNLKIVIFDCYRPISLQKKMFDIVKNPDYVADPKKISKHNRGAAVDVSLANFEGKLLNMGTDFDDFSEAAHYANTAFKSEERKNRKILRDLMVESGFVPYDKEWWHFNFKNTDFPASDFVWKCK